MRRGLVLSLTALAVALLVVGAAGAAGAAHVVEGLAPALVVLLVALVVGLGALWIAFTLVDSHFDALDRLRGDLLSAAAEGDPALLDRHAGEETGPLAAAARRLLEPAADRRREVEARLSALIASCGEAVVLATDTGLVSLVNAAAAARLGAERVALGTSIFAAFDRGDVAAAAAAAERAGGPVACSLRTVDGETITVRAAPLAGGLALFIPAAECGAATVAHDLALHDLPPPAPPPRPDTPLADLPALVLDTETTGLDPERDRIVSVGAVRMHGTRIFRHVAVDRLVDPGMPIPGRAARIHGITTAMVAGASGFDAIWPELCRLMAGTVLIGHNIGFDLALLARETRRLGLEWEAPPALDTGLLAAALDRHASELDLEKIAERLGVSARGRHTALGDALTTAEIHARLLPRLAERGVRTLGEALAFAAAGGDRLARLQRAAGWAPAAGAR